MDSFKEYYKNFIEQSENTVFLKEVLPYNFNENADINTDLVHKQLLKKEAKKIADNIR